MSVEYFLASAQNITVTPPTGLAMSGYLDRTGHSESVLDELEANLIWITTPASDGILWVSLDVLAITPMLRRAIVDAIAERGHIAAARIVVAASHTHAGPAEWHELIHPVFSDRVDIALIRRLASQIAMHSARLIEDARPARLTWRTGDVHGVGGNRHRVDGPHDSSLGLLEVSDLQTNDTIALLFDYACHPTVLGPENLSWSADWVAGARAHIRAARKSDSRDLPVVFLQGCAGDASTRFFRNERSPAEALRLGRIVGGHVVALLDRLGDDIAPSAVKMDRTLLHFPVRGATDTVPLSAEDVPEGRLTSSLEEGHRSLQALREAELPEVLELPVSIVEIGSRRWFHLPVEMCATYGIEIGSGRDDVRVIGYSDGYLGYVADRESFRTGQYEAYSSYFDEETSHQIMVECRDYLDSVYETSRS